ncbi:MAG: hypothetical protein AB8U53_05940 [Rickettsia aeschlimannii]
MKQSYRRNDIIKAQNQIFLYPPPKDVSSSSPSRAKVLNIPDLEGVCFNLKPVLGFSVSTLKSETWPSSSTTVFVFIGIFFPLE